MKEKVKDPRIKSLVAEVAQGRPAEILEEMVENVIRFGKDKTAIADLKLYNRAMRELRHASTIFGNYQGIRKVAVFGSARVKSEAEEYKLARELSRRLVELGWMVITGGGDGGGRRGEELRSQYPVAIRTASQRDDPRGSETDEFSLFLHAQTSFREGDPRLCLASRRIWHSR